MNLYRITHTYSPVYMQKVIASDMSYRDLWNIIKLVQLTCCELDSSHILGEANAVSFLTKYYDATLHEPNYYYDARVVQEIDLHLNWDTGFLDEENNFVRDNTKANYYKQKYDFYKIGVYSFLLKMIMRDHPLLEGDVGDEYSFGMDNNVWQDLYAEGIYNKEILNQIKQEQMEKEKQADLEIDFPLHKVAFHNDTETNFHVSLKTTIGISPNEPNKLSLTTSSVIEAMLLGKNLAGKLGVEDELISLTYKGDWYSVILDFEYKDEEITKKVLKRFNKFYTQIYDEENNKSFLRGKII